MKKITGFAKNYLIYLYMNGESKNSIKNHMEDYSPFQIENFYDMLDELYKKEWLDDTNIFVNGYDYGGIHLGL